MAIAFVARRANAAGQAAALTYTIAVTAGSTGNLLLVAVQFGFPGSGTVTANSVSDNGLGSAWQRDVSKAAVGVSSTTGCALFSTALGGTPPTSLTLTMSAGTVVTGWSVLEFSGTATVSWFDTASAVKTSTAVSTDTTNAATPAAAGELGVGCFGLVSASTAFVAGGSYTSAGALAGVAEQVGAEYLLSVGSGSQTASASWTTGSVVNDWLAFYKAAAAAVSDHLLTTTGVGH